MEATSRTGRNRQYIFPSLNFSCGGVITGWTLKRFDGSGGYIGNRNVLALQLWKQEDGSESTYTLRTEQRHTATTRNAASYAFTASPEMSVAAGDVFGFYVPGTTGLRMAVVTESLHTLFSQITAVAPTKYTVSSSGSNTSPLIFIEFSKSLQHGDYLYCT